jgi:hypothetical protein
MLYTDYSLGKKKGRALQRKIEDRSRIHPLQKALDVILGSGTDLHVL